jgi:hypothetical protein
VLAARAWWDHGALGVDYLTAPAWLHQAFAVISREQCRAMKYRSETERAARSEQHG